MLFELTQVFSDLLQAQFAVFPKTSAVALALTVAIASVSIVHLKNLITKESHVGADVPTAKI